MRVLLVHNRYQCPGGEDAVFAAEGALLRANGHDVVEYVEDNQHINQINRVALAGRTVWSGATHRRLTEIFGDAHVDIAHCHNTFPLISPSAYAACRDARVPVVQTLHNYRLLCPAATLFRNGQLCEECVGKSIAWPGVRHACYRGSRSQTATVAFMIAAHRWFKTWQEQVNTYIAVSEFSRQKFIDTGLSPHKIHVKPNFVDPDPGVRKGNGHCALFIGRLSSEKGIRTMLRAWRRLRDIPLKIVGDGPLLREVQEFVQNEKLSSVEILGHRTRGDLNGLINQAKFLVFPSVWYETFGLVVVEAFACGVPVIASRMGAMADLVEEGSTGLLFRAGDAEDLAEKVRWAAYHEDVMCRMGEGARKAYEQKYTARENYKVLMKIYEKTIAETDHLNNNSGAAQETRRGQSKKAGMSVALGR